MDLWQYITYKIVVHNLKCHWESVTGCQKVCEPGLVQTYDIRRESCLILHIPFCVGGRGQMDIL